MIALFLVMAFLSLDAHAARRADQPPSVVAAGQPRVHHSTEGTMHSKQSDTWVLYGGPGSVLGQFQMIDDPIDRVPDAQAWMGVDRTEAPTIWHASQINCDTIGPAGNWGVIAHHEGLDYSGYGNGWNAPLLFEFELSSLGYDPQTATIDVDLSFDYTRELEAGYDYFRVELFKSNAPVEIARFTGGHGDPTLLPFHFDSDDVGGISYAPGEYNDGKIQLRLRVTTDGAWSDQDGFYNTQGDGAASVDNISVSVNGFPLPVADWEPEIGHVDASNDHPEGDVSGHKRGAGIGTDGWKPTPTNFVGDFSKLFANVGDLDPCREDPTPLWTFIDDGTPANNDPLQTATSGSISTAWSYGIPGGYVVNYTGGLTLGTKALHNEVWSPPIEVDLPGAGDDAANGGFRLSCDYYGHTPLANGIFGVWEVRGYTQAGGWSEWDNDNLLMFSEDPLWERAEHDISQCLPAGVEQIQIALGVWDVAAIYFFPGTDATASPYFDNVTLEKYVIPGPVISARDVNLMNDGFPNDGTLNGSIRWDAARDINQIGVIVPGDSLVADIKPVIPGTGILDPGGGVGGLLRGAIVCNPDFLFQRVSGLAAIGAAIAGVVSDSSDPKNGWEIWEFSVPGQQAHGPAGNSVADRYFWALPDGAPNVNAPHQIGVDTPGLAVFFPGDVIHYFIEATDDQLSTTTLPSNIDGFLDFTHDTLYPGAWTTRGLPSIQGGTQPEILFWNDAGHYDGEDEWRLAFLQNGLYEGEHYDSYTTQAPSSQLGNGLGSAPHHGATPLQLQGYDTLIYSSGSLGTGLISDGTGIAPNGKSNDALLLTDWHNQSAPRYHVYFGEDIVDGMMTAGPLAVTYVTTIVGATTGASAGDVSGIIQGQQAPRVGPAPPTGCGAFTTAYVAYGGCPLVNDFDHLVPSAIPGPAMVPTHEFLDLDEVPYATRVNAGLEWTRLEEGFTKSTMVFAHDLPQVRDISSTPGGAPSARAKLLREILDCFGLPQYGNPISSEPLPSLRFAVAPNHPNPFNPTTTIEYTAPATGEIVLRVFDTRGRLVVEMEHIADVGGGRFEWTGRDAAGVSVASGVYPYEIRGFGETHRGRMVLLK